MWWWDSHPIDETSRYSFDPPLRSQERGGGFTFLAQGWPHLHGFQAWPRPCRRGTYRAERWQIVGRYRMRRVCQSQGASLTRIQGELRRVRAHVVGRRTAPQDVPRTLYQASL